MPNPIHVWEYTEYGNQPARIELYHDHSLHHSSFRPNEPVRRSLAQTLDTGYPLCNLKIDYELIQYIIILTLPEDFEGTARRIYEFYKGFQEQKIIGQVHVANKGNFTEYYYEMTPYGIDRYFLQDDERIKAEQQRFFDFFFYGPNVGSLPLDLRRTWREKVAAALASSCPFGIDDAFVLFDYTKLQEMKFTYKEAERDAGLFFEIYPSHITSGGWEGREGGGGELSIEQLWHQPQRLPTPFQEHWPKIKQNLEGAILGNKTPPSTKEKKAPVVNPGLAGEAPPA